MSDIPTFDEFMNPTIQALKNLGGSGTIHEIFTEVSEILRLSDEQLGVLHNPEKSSQTEVEYRLAWTRTYLKKYGLLENSSRGVWTLTAQGKQIERVDRHAVTSFVRDAYREQQTADSIVEHVDAELSDTQTWREQLMASLLTMAPDAFERLIQRVLRESGFSQVEVTGRSGDGGIDGKGIMQIGGLMSFHVIFQCKRYKNTVVVSEVRDFRGAMVGRADKALFVTTGNFTKDAVQEATRDGAPAIDLIDGEQLMDKLKELSLGVRTKIIQVEEVTVDEEWFFNI